MQGLDGASLPTLVTEVPGPSSRAFVDTLSRHECPAITARRARRAAALGAADDDPVVWAAAVGANVADADGNVFVDFTAGFGVAFVGHRHPAVVAAAHAQVERLLHAAGDAWPDVARIRLLARLGEIAPRTPVAILGLSGADAVDAAVKTAVLATGRHKVVVFEGAYHGLALGTLGLQAYKASFTDPFRPIVHPEVVVVPFGAPVADLDAALDGAGLVLVEPIQGRGGIRVPPPGWLADLTAAAHAAGALVAFDEIQTGLGRAGAWFAGADVDADLVCVGKALGGGFPLSACLGTRAAMDAWGASRGESLHTQTFLGHPIGCAAALAVLDTIAADDLPGRARIVGDRLAGRLRAAGFGVQGQGLMLGVQTGARSLAAARALLARGFLVLPSGMNAEVLALTPPVCLTDAQADAFVAALVEVA